MHADSATNVDEAFRRAGNPKEQPMKKMLALIACFWVMALSSHAGYASPADIMTALKEARGKLVALTGTTDKGTQAALVEEIKAATADVNAKLEATLADPSTGADVKDKLNEFKSIWVEFQNTRDTEIIPAVLAGDTAKAKSIAQGVQVERFKKMAALLQ